MAANMSDLPRVLIVDDEKSMLDTYKRVFRKELNMTLVASANEALRELAIPGNTFVADVSRYVGTGTADKTALTMRLVRGSVRHYVDSQKIHTISFTATKNL